MSLNGPGYQIHFLGSSVLATPVAHDLSGSLQRVQPFQQGLLLFHVLSLEQAKQCFQFQGAVTRGQLADDVVRQSTVRVTLNRVAIPVCGTASPRPPFVPTGFTHEVIVQIGARASRDALTKDGPVVESPAR